MAETPLDALAGLAQSLGESASHSDLERALPLVTRVLKHALRSEPMPDLGEIEPAFGLRFDVSEEASDGTS